MTTSGTIVPRPVVPGDTLAEVAVPLPAASVALADAPPGTPTLLPTLPGSAYTDPAFFAREVERIVEGRWMCAVRTDEIADVGQYRTVTIGRESVIVVRSANGVRAFLNVCGHRGARVCTSASGQVKRTLRCGYHAWSFDLEGRLAAAPNLVKMPDVDRVAQGLHAVSVREWLGYAWVCVDEDPPSFEDTVVQGATERVGWPAALDGYDVGALVLGRRITYDVAANWKLLVENFMECYHCATIHPELTEVLPEFSRGVAAQAGEAHGAVFGAKIEGFTVDGSPGFAPLPGVGEDQDRRYYAATIRPTVFLNLVPDHVILHRMFPMAPDRTIVECDWLYAPDVIASGASIDKSVELFHRVNEQDFEACEMTQPSMSSRAYARGGALVPVEHHVAEFHDWVLEQVGPLQG